MEWLTQNTQSATEGDLVATLVMVEFLGMLVKSFHTLNDFMCLAHKAKHLLSDIHQVIIVKLPAADFLLVDVGMVGAAQILQEEFTVTITIRLDLNNGVMFANETVQNANVILFRATADADQRFVDFKSNCRGTICVLNQVRHDSLLT
jgi:hypothetical protein